MTLRDISLAVVCGILTMLPVDLARGQEGEGEPGGAPRPRPTPEGRPGLRRPPVQRGPLGADIPAVREEMQRHMEATRQLMEGQRDLARQIMEKLRPLRQQGADPAALKEAVKEFIPQAEEVAKKLADLLTTHHENLAKIYKDNREEVVKGLARDILERIALRDPRQGPRPGGDGPRGPLRDQDGGERPRRGGPGGAQPPPQNF